MESQPPRSYNRLQEQLTSMGDNERMINEMNDFQQSNEQLQHEQMSVRELDSYQLIQQQLHQQ